MTDAVFARPVALVVSAFRNDDSVKATLRSVLGDGRVSPFVHVFVVDSLGTGAIASFIAENGFENAVTYENAPINLGAAANLEKRLLHAAGTGADFAFAVNGDSPIDIDAIAKLIVASEGIDRLGAIYPSRKFVKRGDTIDTTGESGLPLPARFGGKKAISGLRDVQWASSNGALYALAPVRAGLRPYVGVWHGFEDLAWGYIMHDAGYRQVVVGDVVVEDNYEYVKRRLGPFTIPIVDKPSWMTYYQVRNLILVATQVRPTLKVGATVAVRVAMEVGVTTVLRDHSRKRLGYLVRGVVDGLRGRTGKWDLP